MVKKMIGRPKTDTTGKKYGWLLVLSDNGETCTCKCDCGNVAEVNRRRMMTGHIKSCGCMKGNPTHGKRHTRLYIIWTGMKARCYNENSIEYKRYGFRGISICEEWKNNFEAFYDWAVENGYEEKLTIDRIDVNGNYEPSNCRWSTTLEQGCNKRNNHFLTVDGETKILSQWEREFNIHSSTMSNWLRRHGEQYAIDRIKELKNEAAMCQKALDSKLYEE